MAAVKKAAKNVLTGARKELMAGELTPAEAAFRERDDWRQRLESMRLEAVNHQRISGDDVFLRAVMRFVRWSKGRTKRINAKPGGLGKR